MLSDSEPMSAFWTIATLVILFGLIPAILFLLGKAATAGTTPDKDQMNDVRRLAGEISISAEKMLTEASRVFGGAAGERIGLNLLIRFADSADRFRMSVLDPERHSSRARSLFRTLTLDFERLQATLPLFNSYRSGQPHLDRAWRAIEELQIIYDAQSRSPVTPDARVARRKDLSAMTQSSNDLDPPLS
jgi:hypothetical protein